MAKDNDKSSFSERIIELTSKEGYKRPIVSPEGYGSFSSQFSNSECIAETGISNFIIKEEERAEVLDNVKILLKILKEADQQEKNDLVNLKPVLVRIKEAVKQVDKIFQILKNHNADEYCEIMSWAMFNLKFFKITNESRILSNQYDLGENFNYLILELRNLHSMFKKRKEKTFEITDLLGIIEKISKSFFPGSKIDEIDLCPPKS